MLNIGSADLDKRPSGFEILGLKTIMAYVSDPDQKKIFGLKSSANFLPEMGVEPRSIVVKCRLLRHCNTEA
jgi:hypothetical protein